MPSRTGGGGGVANHLCLDAPDSLRHCSSQRVKGYLTVARNGYRKAECTQRKLAIFLYENIFIKSSLQVSNNVPLLPFHTRTGDLVFPAVLVNAQVSSKSSTRECIIDTGAGQYQQRPVPAPPQVPPSSQDYTANSHSHFTWLWTHRFLRQTQTTKQASEPNDDNRTYV